MGLIARLMDRLLPSRGRDQGEDGELLRAEFRERYQRFKRLLRANNEALEVMSDVESALEGLRPFGMTFVRSRMTRVAAHVYRMVDSLCGLAPDRYDALRERFESISNDIVQALVVAVPDARGPLTLPLYEVGLEHVDMVGGKMASLAEAARGLGMTVPDGFVVTVSGFRRFLDGSGLQEEIARRLQATAVENMEDLFSLSADVQGLITSAELPKDLAEALMREYERLERDTVPGISVALRSSALGEDMADRSFAGQYRSELNVSRESLFSAYKEVVAGKYGLPAVTYRLGRGIPDEEAAMAVGCLVMVDAVAGGVAYTRDPVDIRSDEVVIDSVWGLPKPVVDGSLDADEFRVSRADPERVAARNHADKARMYVCRPGEGLCRLDLTGEGRNKPSLADDQILELAAMAMAMEERYGRPMDMEWALDQTGKFVLLQCRPLTQSKETSERKEASAVAGVEPLLQGGITASRGVGSGVVHHVDKDMDTLNFPRGGVLVADQALPRWASVLSRASAVVTRRGTATGHLANVCREFHVPALFGVAGATELLAQGAEVTVDAEGLAVYPGRVEELLDHAEPVNLMLGSPVYTALERANKLVTPLHLTDPDAPSFRPESCATLHDITRFCHEKAVHEMFSFGKKHHFPERSSKQLVYEVPLQWRVLNLDDGFTREVAGKRVDLKDIVSIPMLALWRGIVAEPWQGPPALDGKGFLSVMFEATANRSLVTGVKSSYANRNYFMIARNYCSLHSRFGFHFSIVEAFVGDRARENSISFQFKGGAADPERRQRRITMVSDLLGERGFSVEMREDWMAARFERRGRAAMEARLVALGYLIMHTRQLDMVMANQNAVAHYQRRLSRGLDRILEQEAARAEAADSDAQAPGIKQAS